MASPSEKYDLSPNKNFGDVVSTLSKRVFCDGSDAALGHPRVWLDMGVDNQVACKYCDRVFVFEGTLGDGDGNART